MGDLLDMPNREAERKIKTETKTTRKNDFSIWKRGPKKILYRPSVGLKKEGQQLK